MAQNGQNKAKVRQGRTSPLSDFAEVGPPSDFAEVAPPPVRLRRSRTGGRLRRTGGRLQLKSAPLSDFGDSIKEPIFARRQLGWTPAITPERARFAALRAAHHARRTRQGGHVDNQCGPKMAQKWGSRSGALSLRGNGGSGLSNFESPDPARVQK